MVSLNYQTFGPGFYLRLRLYQNGETKYVNVSKLLKGTLQKKHWNGKKQRFIPSAPYSEENNHTLDVFRQPYDELALTWKGTLLGFIQTVQHSIKDPTQWSVADMFRNIIADCKSKFNPDGTIPGTFECYDKCERRMKEYCISRKIDYDQLMLEDVQEAFVNDLLNYMIIDKKGKSALQVSKMLHAALKKAEAAGKYDFSVVEKCKWIKKDRKSSKKYEALTAEQCKKFVNMPIEELPKCPYRQLYRDFCVFVLYTCQSCCDALSLKYFDIQNINGVDHFVFKRRKIAEKQAVDCSVPINAVMKDIMDRWKDKSKDGYIFPVRSKKTITESKTNNMDIKHFISLINTWLKKVGPLLNCSFPLHTYVFRHTAITQYVSKGIPVVYVANLAGTSVSNIESIYYNNQGDTKSRDKILNMTF